MNNSIGFRGEASLTYKEKLLEAYPSIEDRSAAIVLNLSSHITISIEG
jgi:hypothetical protein